MRNIFTKASKRNFSLIIIVLISAFLNNANATCTISGAINVCENTTAAYSVVPTSPNNTYTWNATGGGSVIGTGSSVSVAWSLPGTGNVTVIVKDSLFNVICTNVLTVTIHANPKPVITPSSISGCHDDKSGTQPDKRGGCIAACDSTWITYSTPLHTGSTYTWTVTGSANSSASGNKVNVYWTATGGGSIKVKEVSAYGCIGETEICITIVAKPQAAFYTLPGLSGPVVNACKNQVIQFIDQSLAGTGSPIYSYSWYFGDGGSAFYTAPGSANTTHAYSLPGTYTAMLIVENECHCKDTTKITIVISNSVGPDIFCISTVCPGNTVTYHTNANCGIFNWTATNGSIIGPINDSIVTVQWGSTGPGILSLSVTGCPGFCPAATSVLVPIIPPNATINGPSLVCQGTCYTYSITCDIPLDSIRWHFPAGVTVTTDSINVHEVNVCFYGSTISGNITVDYFHKVPGSTSELSCGGHSILPVSVRPQMFLSGSGTFCEFQPFTYNIFPTPTGTILWSVTNVSGLTTYTSATITGATPFTGVWTYGPGIFIVTAKDLSGNYCNSPQQMTVTVNPKPQPPDSIFGPNPICPNNSYTYFCMPTSAAYAIGWQVTNGTPAIGAGSSLSVTWGPAGAYLLSAVQIDPVTGCKSIPVTKTINSLLPLAPATIIGPLNVCANSDVNYSTTAPGDDWEWSINSGLAGSVKSGQHTQNIVVQWNNYTGTAWLVLIRHACNTITKDSVLITVSYPPIPNITAPPTICEGVPINASSSGAVSYAWNFGDGGTGSGSPASHVYNAPGNYVITLTATYGGSCPGSAINITNIIVKPKPNINISTNNPNLFCNPPVMTNMYVAAPVIGTTYQWYNPSLIGAATGTTYAAITTGTYFVVGTNSFGCSDTSNIIPVSTGNCPQQCTPDAAYGFSFSRIRQGCNTDSFTANITPGIINLSWNFDDPFNPGGASGSIATHTFTEPGYYRVTLCADVPNATGTGYCNICITIVDTIKYIPDFYPQMSCTNYGTTVGVTLINTTKRLSTAPIPSWYWTITPGAFTSTVQNPTTNLLPGIYTATLLVAGTCTIIKTINIPPLPNASFSIADSFCKGKPVIFLNTSTGTSLSSIWNFGDGASSLIFSPIRTYTTSGTFLVTLQIVNSLGCLDTAKKYVTVLPNTLMGFITASGPTKFCGGDSVKLICIPSGGYPSYQYLWSTTQITQGIYALQTGNYGVYLTDSKGCFYSVPPKNVFVKTKPNPIISGPLKVCENTSNQYHVNYPSLPGSQIDWYLDNVFQYSGPTFYYFTGAGPFGSHTIVVNVMSPDTCLGTDTLKVKLYPNPNVSIITAGALCEGSNNMLVALSTSPNIQFLNWSNGQTNDTIYTGIPGNYTVTVTDSNGCSAQAVKVINPLPDLCGLMTGCYEICDSVKLLVWTAPSGYASYQWFYNGNPIPWATSDTIHIPLYKAGTYKVKIASDSGCTVMSDPIDISFVKCPGCKLGATGTIKCGPVNPQGFQTYSMNFTVNNSLGAGANLSIYSSNGTVTGLSPMVLAAGTNVITGTFIDNPPVDTVACFTVVVSNPDQHCDTTICIKVPDCHSTGCTKKVSVKKFDCAGFDGSGNPQYYVCLDITWGGTSGSTMTLNTPSGTFIPNPVTLNNGNQQICFTYTDLPPHSGFVTIYLYFFDPNNEGVCKDSVKWEFKPCPKDSCQLGIYQECAHCKTHDLNTWTYEVELTVNNPFAGNANATILPIAAGTFGAITPNPVPPGLQPITTTFTDVLPSNSIICFRILLTDPQTQQTCWRDICLALPPCDSNTEFIGNKNASFYMMLAPNPASDQVKISWELQKKVSDVKFIITDLSGKIVTSFDGKSKDGVQLINTSNWQQGMYLVRVISDGQTLANTKLIIIKN
jgi:PKD repeat protein